MRCPSATDIDVHVSHTDVRATCAPAFAADLGNRPLKRQRSSSEHARCGAGGGVISESECVCVCVCLCVFFFSSSGP